MCVLACISYVRVFPPFKPRNILSFLAYRVRTVMGTLPSWEAEARWVIYQNMSREELIQVYDWKEVEEFCCHWSSIEFGSLQGLCNNDGSISAVKLLPDLRVFSPMSRHGKCSEPVAFHLEASSQGVLAFSSSTTHTCPAPLDSNLDDIVGIPRRSSHPGLNHSERGVSFAEKVPKGEPTCFRTSLSLTQAAPFLLSYQWCLLRQARGERDEGQDRAASCFFMPAFSRRSLLTWNIGSAP